MTAVEKRLYKIGVEWANELNDLLLDVLIHGYEKKRNLKRKNNKSGIKQ